MMNRMPKPLELAKGVTIFFLPGEERSEITLKIKHPGPGAEQHPDEITEAGDQGLPRYVTLTREEAAKFAYKLADCAGRRWAARLSVQISRLIPRESRP